MLNSKRLCLSPTAAAMGCWLFTYFWGFSFNPTWAIVPGKISFHTGLAFFLPGRGPLALAFLGQDGNCGVLFERMARALVLCSPGGAVEPGAKAAAVGRRQVARTLLRHAAPLVEAATKAAAGATRFGVGGGVGEGGRGFGVGRWGWGGWGV